MKQLPTKAVGSILAVLIALLAYTGVSTNAPSDTDHPQTTASTTAVSSTSADASATATSSNQQALKFRNNSLRKTHFKKHGIAMGYADAQAYEAGANEVVANPASLHKIEREDGDDVYYLQATDEIVFVSTDGYIRTYFNPGGIDYFNRQ